MTLTAEAQRDLAWLIRKLGKEKVSGPEQTTEPPEVVEWMTTLTRADGRKVWYFGPTPEASLAMARQWVEGPAKNREGGVNAIEEQILQAVAQDKVTRNTVLLARRYLAQRERLAQKELPPSVEHHAKVRRQQEREREATSEATWETCLARCRADYWGAYACELGQHGTPRDLLEPHHLRGGSGNRTQAESVETVLCVCRRCHDEFHARPIRWVERIKAWCDHHGYGYPQRKEYR